MMLVGLLWLEVSPPGGAESGIANRVVNADAITGGVTAVGGGIHTNTMLS